MCIRDSMDPVCGAAFQKYFHYHVQLSADLGDYNGAVCGVLSVFQQAEDQEEAGSLMEVRRGRPFCGIRIFDCSGILGRKYGFL